MAKNYSIKELNVLEDVDFFSKSMRFANVESDDFKHFATDIQKRGLLNLVTLASLKGDEEKRLFVTDGNRRTNALKYLAENGSIEPIQSFKVLNDPISETDMLANQISGNANIKSSTNKEYINALYKMATQGNKTMQELAEIAGLSQSYIGRLFKALKLPEEVLEKAEEMKLPTAHLITLSDLSGKVDSPEDWNEWLKRAKELSSNEFAIEVEEEISNLRKEARELRKGKDPVFEPTIKMLKKDEIIAKYAEAKVKFTEQPNKYNEGALFAFETVLSCTADIIAEQKREWEAKQEAKEAKKAKAKKAREEKRAQELKAEAEAEAEAEAK